jgi:hypothetical protein
VSIFWLRREIVFNCTVSKKDSYLDSLIERESVSKCVYFVRSSTLLLCISLLCVYLLYHIDPKTHRLDHFLKFPELSVHVGISRIPSKNADNKIPIFLVNTVLLSRFHKHTFTLYPSLSGQVFLQRMLIEILKIFLVITLLPFCSHKHSFTPYPSVSPYSPTDGMTDGETNTLAACGLKELFFQLCCCVSFSVVAGNSFRCYLPPYQLCRCIFFLVAAGNSFG